MLKQFYFLFQNKVLESSDQMDHILLKKFHQQGSESKKEIDLVGSVVQGLMARG